MFHLKIGEAMLQIKYVEICLFKKYSIHARWWGTLTYICHFYLKLHIEMGLPFYLSLGTSDMISVRNIQKSLYREAVLNQKK